jgi:mono/diheme cytochrome c family protein
MKRFIVALFVVGLMSGMALAADDGAAIYKAKCAMCHGPNGEGKSGPALKGTSLSADQIAAALTKGAEGKKAPHAKPMAGLTADQASAVAAYVKTLK